MKIPDSIQRSHILKALRTMKGTGSVPARRKAKKYHVMFGGRRYPAKYALSLAHTFTTPTRQELRGFQGGRRTNAFLHSRGFTLVDSDGNKVRIPTGGDTRSRATKSNRVTADAPRDGVPTRPAFWVVSPNVRNKDQTVSEWGRASVMYKAAFMGYEPSDRSHKQIGYKFGHVVRPGDVILIARRHRENVEVVGFGVVRGKFQRRVKGLAVPQPFGSLRKLSPFVTVSSVPHNVPLMPVLGHTTALRRLRPERTKPERLVCEWMERSLKREAAGNKHQPQFEPKLEALLANEIQNRQLEYQVRKNKTVAHAKKREAILLSGYGSWLRKKGRSLHTVKYRTLRCDAYEKQRNNLIEAKSSVSREHVRMAVGELLDYSYLGRRNFRNPNMAVLLPARPDRDVEAWLSSLHINVIWKRRGAFRDNASGQFT